MTRVDAAKGIGISRCRETSQIPFTLVVASGRWPFVWAKRPASAGREAVLTDDCDRMSATGTSVVAVICSRRGCYYDWTDRRFTSTCHSTPALIRKGSSRSPSRLDADFAYRWYPTASAWNIASILLIYSFCAYKTKTSIHMDDGIIKVRCIKQTDYNPEVSQCLNCFTLTDWCILCKNCLRLPCFIYAILFVHLEHFKNVIDNSYGLPYRHFSS